MKKVILLAVVAALAMPAGAQGFLNKLKKTAEKVSNVVSTADQAKTKTSTTGEVAGGEQWAPYFDIDVVESVGDKATKEVLLTFVVNKKAAKSVELGGNKDTSAADAMGNRYEIAALNHKSRGSQNLTDGIPRRYQMLVKGVNPSLNEFAAVILNFYAWGDSNLGSNMAGVSPLVFKNVGINWLPEDETSVVAAPWPLKSICDVKVASCRGNKKTGNVALAIAVSTESPKAALGFNSGHGIEIFDLTGKSYNNEYVGEWEISRDLNNVVPTVYNYSIGGFTPGTAAIPVAKLEFYANDYANDLNVGSNMADVEPIMIRNIPIEWYDPE